VIYFEHESIRWEAQPGTTEILKEILISPGTPIKVSPAKSVTRHTVHDRDYYVKRYRHDAIPFRRFKYAVRATQARGEWELAHELDRRLVPAVRHLALGERVSFLGVRESILVTEGFAGQPLGQAPGVDPAVVLRFVERMHEAGVVQEDLHPGNLLVRLDPLEICLVDLRGIRLTDSVSPAERARNLARLCVSFPLPVSDAVRHESARLRRGLLFKRSRRCLRRNGEFAPVWFGCLRWWVRRPLPDGETTRILENPDQFLAERAELLKRGRSTSVGRSNGLVLKRHNLHKAGNVLKDLFRASKARRSYRKAYHLELLGIPTARVIATADRRAAGLLLRSYFLMHEVPGARQLGAILAMNGRVDRRLVWEAGELIGRLHDEGLSHRDLKETNLVADDRGRLHLLDLNGLQFLDVVPDRRAAADLARLARGIDRFPSVQAGDRAAFLRRYCRARARRTVPRLEG